jgi:predicted acetyltransferase
MNLIHSINITNDEITLIDATIEQKEVFRNMMNLQFHDLSEFRDCFDILDDGRFEWTFEGCFSENNKYHHPILIKWCDKIVGVIIFSDYNKKSPKFDYMLVEMFVLRMYRRKGIGKKAIRMIFDNFKGLYNLDVSKNNIKAINFWESLIHENGKIVSEKDFIDENNEYCSYLFEI